MAGLCSTNPTVSAQADTRRSFKSSSGCSHFQSHEFNCNITNHQKHAFRSIDSFWPALIAEPPALILSIACNVSISLSN
ncbi:hypothetical protein VTJ04DRAFT_7696 [Mycothermus thermophilus]|uniref:uncharacterized protein n=1 Tax=Humicola insolens TaxID=85995 RepID=UPI003742AFB2